MRLLRCDLLFLMHWSGCIYGPLRGVSWLATVVVESGEIGDGGSVVKRGVDNQVHLGKTIERWRALALMTAGSVGLLAAFRGLLEGCANRREQLCSRDC